jgi:hypothetical protein
MSDPADSSREDPHMGIQYRTDAITLDNNVYEYDPQASINNRRGNALGKAAFQMKDFFFEVGLINTYQVSILEKQIADLIWDTVDENDPRIKSGTISMGRHVFNQQYSSNAGIRMGYDLNKYITAEWNVQGTVAKEGGSDGILESSSSISLTSKAKVSIEDLSLLCDDLALLFDQPGSTSDKMAFAKTQVSKVIKNRLTIDFAMASGSSTDNWKWKQNDGIKSGDPNDDFEARLDRMKNKEGWFADAGGDPFTALTALFIPTNVTFQHELALTNGVTANSSYNMAKGGTFETDIKLFDKQVNQLFGKNNDNADGAAEAKDDPTLGRIKGGIRISMKDVAGGVGNVEVEIPLTYSKSFTPRWLGPGGSVRVDAGLSIKAGGEQGFEIVPSAEISGKAMKYFKYDFDLMERKGHLSLIVDNSGAMKKVNDHFKKNDINAKLNWDIDLKYDFNSGASSWKVGLSFEMYEEMFNFGRFGQQFGSLMIQVKAGAYVASSTTNISQGFDNAGVYFFAGAAVRLIYKNHIMSWLGFPIDIHPYVGAGASVSFTFAAATTTLQSHKQYHTKHGANIENNTDTLGWGAFFGAFGWNWKMADNIRQYMTMRNSSFLHYIPILGPFLGRIADAVPVLTRIGKREPIVTFLIRAQFARSFMAFNAAVFKCSELRTKELVRIARKQLQLYIKVAPNQQGASPYSDPAYDSDWLDALENPNSDNYDLRLARAIQYYLARGLGLYTFKSPHCSPRPDERDKVRNLTWPDGTAETKMRMEPVPGCNPMAQAVPPRMSKCVYRLYHALDPFKGPGGEPAYVQVRDGGKFTGQGGIRYRQYGFWDGHEMLKAFTHVPHLLPGSAIPDGYGGEHPERPILYQYQEYVVNHPKCACIRSHYWNVQKKSEYWNIFDINSLKVGNVKDAFEQLGRHSQDTIVGTIMQVVAQKTFDAIMDIDLKKDIELEEYKPDTIAEGIKDDKLEEILGEVYKALVDAQKAGVSYHYSTDHRHENRDKVDADMVTWFEDQIMEPGSATHLQWADNRAARAETHRYRNKKEFIEQVLKDMKGEEKACEDKWFKVFCFMGAFFAKIFRWMLGVPFKILSKYNPIMWAFSKLRSGYNKFKVDRNYLVSIKGSDGRATSHNMRGLVTKDAVDQYGNKIPADQGDIDDELSKMCDDPELNPVDGDTPPSFRDSSCIAIAEMYPRQWYGSMSSLYASMGSPTTNLPAGIADQTIRATYLMNGYRTEDKQRDTAGQPAGGAAGTVAANGFYSVMDEVRGANHGVCLEAMSHRSALTSLAVNPYANYYKKYSFYLYDLINTPETQNVFAATYRLANDLDGLHVIDLQRDFQDNEGNVYANGEGDDVSDRCGLCLKKVQQSAGVSYSVNLEERRRGLSGVGAVHNGEGWYNHNQETATRYGGGAPASPTERNHQYYNSMAWFDTPDHGGSLTNTTQFGNSTTRDQYQCAGLWAAETGGLLGITEIVSGNHFLITGDVYRYQIMVDDLATIGSPKLAKLAEQVDNFNPCLEWGASPLVEQKWESPLPQKSQMGLVWMPKDNAGAQPDRYDADSIPGAVGQTVANGGYVYQSHFDDELHRQVFTNTRTSDQYSCADIFDKFLLPMWGVLNIGGNHRVGKWKDGAGDKPVGDWWGAQGDPVSATQSNLWTNKYRGSKAYQDEMNSWPSKSLVTVHAAAASDIPHGYSTQLSNGSYSKSMEIFYGLKVLWETILAPSNTSSLPHIKEVHMKAIRQVKAQAKIIEMIWRAQMLRELAWLVPGNGSAIPYNVLTKYRRGKRYAHVNMSKHSNFDTSSSQHHRFISGLCRNASGYRGCGEHFKWNSLWNMGTWLLYTDILRGTWADIVALGARPGVRDKDIDDILNWMKFAPMSYLAKTFNKANGRAANHTSHTGVMQRLGAAVGRDHEQDSLKLLEFDITRFNENYFGSTIDQAGGDMTNAPGAQPTNQAIYDSTFGKWYDKGSATNINYRSAFMVASSASRSNNRGSAAAQWLTSRNDIRALCQIPSNLHWVDNMVTANALGQDWKYVAEMWAQLRTCHKADRWTQMLDRPQWLRDGCMRMGSTDRFGNQDKFLVFW